MPKLPHLSGKEIVKALANAGFQQARQKGSHVILIKHTEHGRRGVVVPLHKEVDIGTLVEVIRQAGLKREEFLELL